MKRKSITYVLLPILALLAFNSCKEEMKTDISKLDLIPKPLEIVVGESQFHITEKTKINASTIEAIPLAAEMESFVLANFGISMRASQETGIGKNKALNYIIDQNSDHGKEGYKIEITTKQLNVVASSPAGLYMGMQTLKQMLLLKNAEVIISEDRISVPTGTITDKPEYEYRGVMLDVSRHFFDAETVKKYIDLISLYKINVLHLHLSDDQGWRIEIKSWPKLTEIGGSTEVGGGKGGFYTQEEFKDLVAYADSKFITIIPEIDMPGHTNAALASYAELNCNGKAPELYTGTKVGFSTLCTDKDITYKFIDDVVREISSMITGPYFHMGGDESHVTALPDYIYFVNKVRDIVKSHGKTMIGWDEISHGAISEGDVAQYWASAENALRAKEKGAKLIISPAKQCYLDMKYNENTKLGLNWAAYIELDAAYNWSPLNLVEGIDRNDILGIESPLWAETIESLDDIEFLTFPRVIGHAEIGWANADSLSWEDYKNRLTFHGSLMEKLEIDFYKSPLINWKEKSKYFSVSMIFAVEEKDSAYVNKTISVNISHR